MVNYWYGDRSITIFCLANYRVLKRFSVATDKLLRYTYGIPLTNFSPSLLFELYQFVV